jgi:acetyl esterase/lipase
MGVYSFFSFFLFCFSLLAVFKAYLHVLWIPSIAATEGGHYFALISFICFGVGLMNQSFSRAAVFLSFFATLFFISPVLRSLPVSWHLPQRCTTAFGIDSSDEKLQAPLELSTLFFGTRILPVKMETLLYAHKDQEALTMDVYSPQAKGGSRPALVLAHSGSWSSGDKDELPSFNRYFASKGFVVASVNYRLAPRYPFPAASDDILTAIDYLKSHAQALGVDPTQLVVVGRSAGGQVALSAAYSHPDPSVRGVISLYAPNDLLLAYSLAGNKWMINSSQVLENYLSGPPSAHPGAYEAASPLNFVNEPPTLMIHGYRDEFVWPLHDERLEARLTEFKRPHLFLRLPWATHACEASLNGPSGQLSLYAIERFLAFVCPVKRGGSHV